MFAIPSVRDLANRARQAFKTYLPGADAWLQKNNIYPTAKVFGGLLQELFERLDWVMKQAFVLYAEDIWLDRHGEQYGLPRKAATLASGSVVITATDAIDVPAGTQFTLGSSGLSYQSAADASLSAAGTLTVSVTALSAGADSNALANSPLTISSGTGAGISGPGSSSATAAIGADGIANGTDDEKDGPYRARILFRMRNPPHGGNAADYVMWASTVPGVTRVFVERVWRGAGTVRVFPIFDDLFAGNGGIPTDAYVTAVADALELVQPSAAIVTVAAAGNFSINVTIDNLSPDTTVTRNAVNAELLDMFRRKGRVAGSDKNIAPMPYLARPFTFAALWIQGAVDNAAGVDSADVVGAADQVIPVGSIPVLGTVTFGTD